jgi:flagellar biosynthetic protein FlhB
MTREEVRRENKEEEGDPRHKQERRRLRDELLRSEGLRAVRKADCVVVNPEHVAVAIRFDRDIMQAPQVVAKGEDLMAEAIRREARLAGVPIVRNVPLARALCELDEGTEIPSELYEAMAEVLRFVYRIGGQPIAEGPVAPGERR